MAYDNDIEAHKTWIDYVLPVGLLVSPAVLVERGIQPDANAAPLQQKLRDLAEIDDDDRLIIGDFRSFVSAFLEWQDRDLIAPPGQGSWPEELSVRLAEYNEVLEPSFAIPAAQAADGKPPYQALIKLEPLDADLDADVEDDGKRWVASPQARFERLLRETNVPIGLLANGRAFRLVYAPRGESSGFATFQLANMLEVAGRPIAAAFHMLLHINRLVGSPEQSLPALLAESRLRQERVSTELAGQVLGALNEMLRGLHAADKRLKGDRIVALSKSAPDQLYGGLLTALMRLVFILYAEDRGLFPKHDLWVQHYSLTGLFRRLRNEAALYPDGMDDRFGAWAHLIALWRLIYGGGQHDSVRLTPRKGRLFDPDRFPFLEGRTAHSDPVDPPPVSDGVVLRVLEKLLILNGERLSYRTLDVEQIGSVYQAVMGFTIERTTGRSIAIRPPKKGGAAATIDLEQLLAIKPESRAEWIREHTDRKVSPGQAKAVKASKSTGELESALESVIDRQVTPTPLGKGIPVLQPTEERRRTGSHYTPRALTQPIVAETLRPIFERLGANISAAQILDLKVLDPAVGSGAFLVEACRQIGDALVAAWVRDGNTPALPPDEDAVLHARRLVAQKCLFGVDRNAMAADLAKLSIWLETLARDHEFTFLDHSIRHGDSLVGLTKSEIAGLHWADPDSQPFAAVLVRDRLAKAERERQRIRAVAETEGEGVLRPMLDRADQQLTDVKLVGDAVVAAFFAGENERNRNTKRQRIVAVLGAGGTKWQDGLLPIVNALQSGDHPVYPFHWEIEYPEVFERENPGFDAVIGNPPYAGKNTISAGNREHYLDWLQALHEGAHGNADLVAHFFRRAFCLLRKNGSFGLIATNTIRQGDTRATGLRWIRQQGGAIYAAKRRYKWPGEAAVVVCVIHVCRGNYVGLRALDGKLVSNITAFLVERGGDDDPKVLVGNSGKSFQGSIILGMGFTFDDADSKGKATPIAKMRELIKKDPKNKKRIFPYVGGEEINTDPQHRHHRFVIDFSDYPLKRDSRLKSWDKANEQVRAKMLTTGIVPDDYPHPVAADWPDLLKIVEEKVKPERDKVKDKGAKALWWRFIRRRPELYNAIRGLERVLVTCRVSERLAFTFMPSNVVLADSTIVFPLTDYSSFCVLQSRVHEVWARLFSSSMKDDLRYTPSDAFETFPLPSADSGVESAGRHYFEFRANYMADANEGMTKIYNRFNDPNDKSASIVTLRKLHLEMDRSVLRAYGWDDLNASVQADFEREWEDDEDAGPWRFRWPEFLRDEVLGRLLELNAERAKDEEKAGLTEMTQRRGKSRRAVSDDQPKLI